MDTNRPEWQDVDPVALREVIYTQQKNGSLGTKTMPDRPVSSQEAMEAVVKADGDLALAASRLVCQPANILAAIACDPANHDTLSKYFRAHQTVKLFSLVDRVSSKFESEIDDLSPKDTARVLTSLLEMFEKYTTPSAPVASGNPMENAMKMFPPHVQEHIRLLANQVDEEVA